MFRLLTDFNETQNGIARGLEADAEGPRRLQIDDRVLLHDGGEHEALATVIEIENGLVRAHVDWATWADAGTYKPQRHDNTWVIASFDTGWTGPTRGDEVFASEAELAGTL